MTGVVALAALAGGTIPAVAATAAPAHATTAAASVAGLPAAVRPAADSSLSLEFGSKISCGSTTACLAVGSNLNDSTLNYTPAAEALSGTKWKPVAV